ncbi:HlyD family type I secretion periplasmic adaptor subunit [Maricaulis sp.]|uniref:HlyD family type I secretion periplasmic adaptor subunit n=2 Tax=unclassified Maricaulis TaxID=2632371 RepID=UPI001B233640|nr:HlyD family type I secretion periplasmic adaptor subunit [Maricaulis sp.]MBO6796502.1 HlyD family type I secretion periplasmic adaptor subunit [Maricaulis sp.]
MVQLMKDPTVRFSAIACAVGLGGFLVWAGFVPLSEGVPANGMVVVENSRQVVQHLEGGIIEELLVRDGDQVEAGQPLLSLQATASQAVRDEILQEIASSLASLARLEALREEEASPDFSAIDMLELGSAERAAVIERQQDLFDQQRQSFEADLGVLQARRDGASDSIRLYRQQITTTERALAAAEDQADLLQQRVDRQMARVDELRAMERDVANLETQIGGLRRDAQQAETTVEDLESQIAQTEANFLRIISTEQLEARTTLEAAEERLSAAQDVLNRIVISAPQAGEVLNLAFSTRGGVVRPGEAILEIVPEVEEVTVSARIGPGDRAAVFQGQAVRTHFTAYKSWMTPRLDGEVTSVSADLKTDQVTGDPYYEVRIVVPSDQIDRLDGLSLTPGMPAQVFIFSGTRRTTLDYLLEPISESLFRGARRG